MSPTKSINPNHFQNNRVTGPKNIIDMISPYTGHLYTRNFTPPTHSNTIHIVIGPVRCGKSTYIRHHAMPDDIIITNRPLTYKSLLGIHGKTIWKEHDLHEFINVSPSSYYQDLILTNHVYFHDMIPQNHIVHIYRNNTYIKTINYPTTEYTSYYD